MSQVSTTAADDVASMMEGEIRAGEEASSSVGGIPGPFMPRPFVTYTGHTSDLLDVSWSKVKLMNLKILLFLYFMLFGVKF